MDSHLVPTSTETHTPPPEVVTETAIKAIDSDEENFAALAGGAIAAVLLVLTCVIAMLLWCLSRHKGSYVTNEMDEDEDDNEDDESVGSDIELQTKEPLNIKEEE
ncbi:small cell adhesion glycoprotein homolog [Toxotes jaculatrix]|uniref:small cell adhesion glycoprotein homolog n=1 Tax=Toxotes jaculatrix TaxID=941984 RepID=UPI001B3AF7EC|nr:small cell adhesion glycoprotein homolog [Toxotes jaculatrix]